jgi:hypothetical protein
LKVHETAILVKFRKQLSVVRANPAEVDRLRALHQLLLGAHTRRPRLRDLSIGLAPDGAEA